MPVNDISSTSLIFCFFLLTIPIFISRKIGLELEKSTLEAIKYQITIMIAIYVSTLLSTTLSILISFRTAFDEHGLVNKEIYRNN